MFLFVIAGLAISVSGPMAALFDISVPLSVLATWVLCAAGLPLGLLLALAARRGKTGASAQDRAVYIHRVQILHNLCLIALFCASHYVFGWRRTVWEVFGRYQSVALVELLSVAPFLVSVALSWVSGHMMGAMLRSSRYRLRDYVMFQLRGIIVTVMPWFVFLAVFDSTGLLPDRAQDMLFLYPFLLWLITVGLLGVMFVAAPWFLKIVWAPRPLPAGEIRSRLERLCREVGFTYRDILVWKTAGGSVNAGVVGLMGPLRYILITDAMLKLLPIEEVEAVLAHEIGHAVHLHIPWYAVLSFGYVSLMMAGWGFVSALGDAGSTVAMLSFFTVYWVVIFGFVSRRLERQADLYSARTLDDFSLVARALERVAVLNGHVQKVFSLRHFSIAKRIRFLLSVSADPSVGRRADRGLTVVMVVLVVVVLGGLAGAARVAAHQIHDPSERFAMLAREAFVDREYERAREYARSAIDSSPRSKARYHALLGDCLQAVGDNGRALAEYQTALHLADPAGRLGRDLIRAIRALVSKDP